MYANPFNSNDPNNGYSINNNSWNGDGPYSPFGMPMLSQWGGGGGGGGGSYTPPVLPNPVFVPPSYVVNNAFRVNLSSDNSCEFFENSKSVGIGLATTLNKTSLQFGDTKYEAVNNSKVTLNYFNVTIQKKNISVNTLPATTPNLLPISNGPWSGFFNGFGANTTSTNNGSSFFGGTLGTFNIFGSNNINAAARTTSIFGNPFNLNFNVGPAPTVNDANFVEQISIKEYQLGTDGLTYTLLGEQKLNIGSTINLQFRFKERVIKTPPTDVEIKGDNPPPPPPPPKEVVNPNVQYEIAIGSNFESELGSNIKVSYKIVTKTGEVADGGSVLLANRNTNGKEISEDILKDCTVYFTIEGDVPTEYSYRGIYYNNIDVIKKQPARDSIDYTSWNKGDKVFTIPGSQLKGGVGIAVIFEKVITYNKPELTVNTKQYNVEVKDSDTNKQVNILFESLYADYVDVYTSANHVIRVNASQRFANLFFKEDFNGLYGSNKITLVPFSEKYGTGDRTDILINFVAINDFPSVTQIVFPDLIDVPSFSDLNIDWEVHYNTFAVTSVDVYLLGKDKTSRTQLFGNLEPNGSFTINLRSLASRFPVWNGSDAVTLIFKPYNRSGTKELLGNEYEITTKVIYPEIQLDEDIIRSAIFDSFMAKLQFTEPEKESKYLTHLANFGEDEHILISTFEEDKWTLSDKVQDAFGNTLVSNEVSSLILKLYSPLPDTYTENSTLWITKLMTNPLVETIILNEQDNLECPPIKGPNFNIDVDYTKSQSTNYQSFDELILSSSVSTVSDNIVAYLSSSINGTEDLNIQYASGSVGNGTATYLWDNFVHFSSAEDRVDNFIYKVQLIERYDELIDKAQTGVSANSISATNEIARQTAKKNTLINGFDGFEKFLWEYSDKFTNGSQYSLTWPWQVGVSTNDTAEGIVSYTNSTEFKITISNTWGDLAANLQTGNRINITSNANQGNFYVKRIDGQNFLIYHDAALKRPVDSRGFTFQAAQSVVFKLYEDVRYKSDTTNVQAWYNNLIEYAAAYDINNQNYILNNIPQYILTNTENENLLLFFSMIGQYFDSLYYYTKALERSRGFGYKATGGVADKLLFDLLKTFSWDAKNLGVDAEIWEYIYGADSEGNQRVDTPSKKRTKDVWRRILNNIPHLLKHKGTKRGVYALMACYGIPASNLSIIEFGGPETSIESKGKLVMDNATNVVVLDGNSYIKVPWNNTQLNRKPDTIEVFLKPNPVNANNGNRWTVISGSNWNVVISGSNGSEYGKVLFYYYGSNALTSSLLPIFNDRYFGISITKNYESSSIGAIDYKLDVKQSNVNRTIFSASYVINQPISPVVLESGSFIAIGSGAYGFSGSVDEFRMWSTPLSASKFFEHCSYPEMINGNHISSSTTDLYFRLDFEYPKNLNVYPKLINIAPSVYYSGSLRRNDYELGNTSRLYSLNTSASFSASAINFTTKPTYPHSFEDIERTIVLEVPDLGVSRYATDKIRFEEQELSSDLSSKHRSTVKSFDHAPVDSNRIGIFFSPTKELNFDIAKSFGSENLDNYIGDPSDKYAETYKDLNQLRTYYFKRIHNRNIYEYIDLIKVYEKAMFDDIKKMLPARSKPATGLLIEPHILERSKVKQNKPTGVNDQVETIVDAEKNTVVTSDIEQYESIVDADLSKNIFSEPYQYESRVNADLSENIFSEAYQYDSVIGANDDINLSSELVGVETDVDCQLYKPTVVSSIDLFETTTTVGQTAYEDVGFGLYAENGHAIRTYFNKDNRLVKERVAVSLVTERKSFTTYKYRYILPNGLADARGGLIQTSSIYYERSLNVQSYSGSVLPTFPTVSGNITSVEKVSGYLPTHNKFTSDLTAGMNNSYYKGCKNTAATTLDGTEPVETFVTNPNALKVNKAGRDISEPILEVE